MTQEQYYWLIRRQQLIRAWNAKKCSMGGSSTSRSFHFEKTDNKYLFFCESDGDYNEDEVNSLFEAYAFPLASGRCSSVRVGKKHARNYDWYFDQAPTFIMKTPKTASHSHKTLGVATLMSLRASEISDGWKPEYAFLECAIVDGINDVGLVCNLNVCPPGDNPNYPTLQDEADALAAGVPEVIVRNVTTGTNNGKPRRFVGQICRTLLDNFSSCEEVKAHINDYSWYAVRNPEVDFKEEFHVMVSDARSTLVIEFIENSVVIHEWNAAGTYSGCSDPELAIGKQVLPVMTNFYLSKWDGELSNLSISRSVPAGSRNSTVTEYGMGYERYVKIDGCLKNPPSSWKADDIAQNAMHEVSYRQIYVSSPDDWTSEFLLRTDDPSTSLHYRLDMLDMQSYVDFRARAKVRCEAEDEDDKKGIRPESGVTWQTVHSSTYDIESLTLNVFSQEDYTCMFTASL